MKVQISKVPCVIASIRFWGFLKCVRLFHRTDFSKCSGDQQVRIFRQLEFVAGFAHDPVARLAFDQDVIFGAFRLVGRDYVKFVGTTGKALVTQRTALWINVAPMVAASAFFTFTPWPLIRAQTSASSTS